MEASLGYLAALPEWITLERRLVTTRKIALIMLTTTMERHLKIRGLLLPSLVVLSFMTQAKATSAEDKRADKEAEEIYRLFTSSASPTPLRCQYSVGWGSEVVPEYVARKYFGATLRSGLSAPDHTAGFQPTIDPEGKYTKAFCPQTELTDVLKTLKEQFISGRETNIVFETIDLTFPIFDRNYNLAVITASYVDRGYTRRSPADKGAYTNPHGYYEKAYIYAKVRGHWKLKAAELLNVS